MFKIKDIVNKIHCADCIDFMKEIPINSIDALICDPPYALNFMGKDWDKAVPGVNIWKECLRVLKPGAFCMVMSSPRQDVLSRMIVNLEDAGFRTNFTSIYWAYATGFPKAGNVAKIISKRIDKLKENYYICDIWKKYLKDVKIVGKLYLNELIEVGLLTTSKNFVPENVQKFYTTKKLNVDVIIVEKNLKEAQAMLKNTQLKNIIIVPENVETNTKQKKLNVHIVEINSKEQNQHLSIKIIFVPVNVQACLCEKIMVKIKGEEVPKIENGNVQYLKEININVLCAELIENLKHITLNQLKNILNYDTTFQMELLPAITVIITKSIMECLITNMGNMLSKNLNGSFLGFQPKPAVEVIIICMKPLSEKTYIDQALKNGKGITWLDDCMIPLDGIENHTTEGKSGLGKSVYGNYENKQKELTKLPRYNIQGRFPANLLVSDDILNDGKISKGQQAATTGTERSKLKRGNIYGDYSGHGKVTQPRGDSGSFSRYFDLDRWAIENGCGQTDLFEEERKRNPKDTFPFLIVSKASKSEKEKGLNGLPKKQGGMRSETSGQHITRRDGGDPKPVANHHPTVKPIKLMKYLITLATRKNDLVLDPFTGSGTTCIAAKQLGRQYIGIELSEEYCNIANKRLNI